MSSPCRSVSLAIVAALALGACDRETRHIKSKPETGPDPTALSDLYPGGAPPAAKIDARVKEYEGNAYHIAQGQRYYRWFNCNGCHANGGGGMGPALMDADWRYGGDIQHIYATIEQGRPNGMPAFRDKIPETQIWEIAAYVRALNGNVDRLAAPSRSERMQSIPPINNINRIPPRAGDPSASGPAR
jgi:cytochrome c oxidase cbb3-type subunit III